MGQRKGGAEAGSRTAAATAASTHLVLVACPFLPAATAASTHLVVCPFLPAAVSALVGRLAKGWGGIRPYVYFVGWLI